MRNIVIVIAFLFLLSCSNKEFYTVRSLNVDKAEDLPHDYTDTSGYDSLGNRRGFWRTYSVINYRTDKGFLYYTEGYEYGYYLNGKKEGAWVAKDNDNNIIGYITYEEGLRIEEVQIINKRVISIIKIRVYQNQEQDTCLVYGEIAELITFNKRGKIRSRFLLMGDSVITKEFF